MNYAERGLLTDVRRALLHLHKTLLDWERTAYERIHGRVSSHDLLQAILNDPQFAWLRPLSELIVRIDELMAHEAPDTSADVNAILDRARALVSPEEGSGPYAQRYHAALQEHPDAVFAHRDVSVLLKRDADSALPSQRPH
jgi:hypothetical protein